MKMNNAKNVTASSLKFVLTIIVLLLVQMGTNAQTVPGTASDIDVGVNGEVWLIGTDAVPGGFGIYKLGWDNAGRARIKVDGAAVRVAVDNDGEPWVVNSSGEIYRRQKNAWTGLQNVKARDIEIDNKGIVWIADSDGNVRRRNADGSWVTIGTNMDAKRIAVDVIGVPWIINNNNSLLWRQNEKWVSFNSKKAVAIGIGGNDSIWTVDNYKRAGELSGFNFTTIQPQGFKEIAVDWKSTAWIIKEDGTVSTYSGTHPLRPRDDFRAAYAKDNETDCVDLAKRRSKYTYFTTPLYDEGTVLPPDWETTNLPTLCKESKDYTATVGCFEGNRFAIGKDKAMEKCRGPYILPDGRTITFKNEAGYVAQMMVIYLVSGPNGVVIPKTVFTDKIAVGQKAVLVIPDTAPNTKVTISFLGVATIPSGFFSTTLDSKFTGDPCYKAWGTIFSPQGGKCN